MIKTVDELLAVGGSRVMMAPACRMAVLNTVDDLPAKSCAASAGRDMCTSPHSEADAKGCCVWT